MESLESRVKNALSQSPFQESNLLSADLIETLEVKDDTAMVTLNPLPFSPEKIDSISEQIADALRGVPEINEVEVFTPEQQKQQQQKSAEQGNAPKSNPALRAAEPQQNAYLQNYEHIVLVASGKGGVGKSTVALNLALALQQNGKSVSLFDADIYGPSIPLMLGMRGSKPKVEGDKILPMQAHGLDFISVGNLISEGESVLWRGPMVHQAVEQLMRDTLWPGGDYMIFDMPPGTGDIQISLSQMAQVSGAVIVCTPQDVALIDARRALSMFDKVDIPIIGVIENMSGFLCPHCKVETPIFGKGGMEQDSRNFNLTHLGSIPIELDIRLGSDQGKPITLANPSSHSAMQFMQIAREVDTILYAE